MILKRLVYLIVILTALSLSAQNYTIERHVFGSSAQEASNSNYSFQNTAGQSAIGQVQSSDNMGQYGFWYDGSQGTSTTLTIDLQQGWSYISSNVVPQNLNISSIMSSVSSDVIIVRDDNGDVFLPQYNLNTIGNWAISEGYEVYASTNTSFDVTGTAADINSYALNIDQGWNWIGYVPQSPMDAATALNSVKNNVIIVKDENGDVYIPSFGLNTIGDMEPAEGYQLYASTNFSFNYPAPPLQKTSSSANLAELYNPKKLKSEYRRTGNNHILIVTGDVNNGTEIAAYNSKNEIVGSGVFRNNIAAITIWGDNERTEDVTDGAAKDEALQLKMLIQGALVNVDLVNPQHVTENNDIAFEYEPEEVTFAKLAGQYAETGNSVSASPNPFGNRITVRYTLENNSEAELYMVDPLGKRVATISEMQDTPQGTYKKEFFTNDLTLGAYYIVLRTRNGKITFPVTKVE